MEISSLNQAPFDRSRNSRKVVAFLVGLAFPLFCLGSGKPVLSWSSGQGTARGSASSREFGRWTEGSLRWAGRWKGWADIPTVWS